LIKNVATFVTSNLLRQFPDLFSNVYWKEIRIILPNKEHGNAYLSAAT